MDEKQPPSPRLPTSHKASTGQDGVSGRGLAAAEGMEEDSVGEALFPLSAAGMAQPTTPLMEGHTP